MMRKIFNRIYSDFLMPSRLREFENILIRALEAGYHFRSVIDLFSNPVGVGGKTIILRHDIDTDSRTAEEFFTIERKLGISSSYYFRRSTMDFNLMRAIHESGSEASYHYEEIADHVKNTGTKDRNTILNDIDHIRLQFKKNFLKIKSETGLPLNSVASHGDFINRRINIPNYFLLEDESFRTELDIHVECYDRRLLDKIDLYISDSSYPLFFNPMYPDEAFNNFRTILILIHPRHWHARISENLKENFTRFRETLSINLTS